MAVLAAARSHCGDCGMQESREKALAGAAIIRRVFVKGFGQRILRRGCCQTDAQIAGHSRPVGIEALSPGVREVESLVDRGRERGTCKGYRTERVPRVVVESLRLRRGNVYTG